MPKIEIQYDLKGVEIYRGDSHMSGDVILQVGEAVIVKFIDVDFRGSTLVKWTEFELNHTHKFITHEDHVYNTQRVLRGNQEGGPVLQPGTYRYPFKFYIPKDRMPSTFQGAYGATKWFLHFHVGRPLPYSDIHRYKTVAFIDDYKLDNSFYSKRLEKAETFSLSRALGIGDAGQVVLNASIDRSGYCAGEYIRLNVNAENKSTKDLGKVQAKLYQSVRFKANGENKYTTKCLRSIVGDPLKKGGKCIWKNQKVQIDAVPNSTQRRSTYCIFVSYYLEVIVPVPLLNGKDLKIKLNFEIGTSPTDQPNRNVKPEPQAATDIPVTDARNATTYTKCNKGWQYFDEGISDVFPILTDIPVCVYNPNYQPADNVLKKKTNAQTQTSTKTTAQTQTKTKSAKSSTPTTKHTKPDESLQTSSNQTINAKLSPQTNASQSITNATANNSTSSVKDSKELAASEPPENLRMNGHYRNSLEPSAPPSYESIMGQENVTEVSDDEEEPMCYMLVRFNAEKLQQYKQDMTQTSSHLNKCGGKILVMPKNVYYTTGQWTNEMLLSVIQFNSKEDAKQWTRITPHACDVSWLGGCELAIVQPKEVYQEGKGVLQCTVTESKPGYDPKERKEFLDIYVEYMKPNRLSHGGVLLVAAKTMECLRGDWRIWKDGSTLSMILWNSKDNIPDYSKLVPTDVYQRFKTLSSNVFTSRGHAKIEIENIQRDNTQE